MQSYEVNTFIQVDRKGMIYSYLENCSNPPQLGSGLITMNYAYDFIHEYIIYTQNTASHVYTQVNSQPTLCSQFGRVSQALEGVACSNSMEAPSG